MTKRAWLSIALGLAGILPGFVVAVAAHTSNPFEIPAVVSLVLLGLAVWCAATVLSWAGEALEIDLKGTLALALLAIVAILPEYVVDVDLALKAGADPVKYAPLASANMNGATRLLVGFALPLVVLVAAAAQRRRRRALASEAAAPGGPIRTGLTMPAHTHGTLFFIVLACAVAIGGVLTGQLHIAVGVVLLVIFGVFLFYTSRGEEREPDLVGVSAQIGDLPRAKRLALITALFLMAGATIFVVVEPFIESLVHTASVLGISDYFLIKWLAPIASEAPEVILALTLAAHRKPAEGVLLLCTAIANQWSALVGSLPVAFKIGGGDWALPLTHADNLQVKEFLLTASVTAVAVAFLVGLRVPLWAPAFMLVTFVAEFALPNESALMVLAAINAAVALVILGLNRRQLPALVKAPFQASHAQE